MRSLSAAIDAANWVAQAAPTAAQQVQPLELSQLSKMMAEIDGVFAHLPPDGKIVRFARAIERAHGIGAAAPADTAATKQYPPRVTPEMLAALDDANALAQRAAANREARAARLGLASGAAQEQQP